MVSSRVPAHKQEEFEPDENQGMDAEEIFECFLGDDNDEYQQGLLFTVVHFHHAKKHISHSSLLFTVWSKMHVSPPHYDPESKSAEASTGPRIGNYVVDAEVSRSKRQGKGWMHRKESLSQRKRKLSHRNASSDFNSVANDDAKLDVDRDGVSTWTRDDKGEAEVDAVQIFQSFMDEDEKEETGEVEKNSLVFFSMVVACH